MPTALHVLILEDTPADVELLLHELRRAGFEPHWQHVATEPDFLAGLAPPPDIVLADYTVPQFDALRALRCVQERAPDIPLIVVTGALSDEAAVACLKQGAADYLLKDRLGRLGQAVRQALAARDLRVQHRQAHDALRASEGRFRALSEHASDLVGILDANGTYRYASPSHQRILGYAPAEVQGRNVFELMHPNDLPHTQAAFAALMRTPGAMEAAEFRMRHADGSWRTLEGIGTNRLHDPALRGIIANAHDITERKRAERRLAAQHAVTRALAQASTVGEATRQVLQSICDSLGWDCGVFWRVDAHANVLRRADLWHVPALPAPEFADLSRQTSFPLGLGLPGRVWACGEALWIPDVLTDPNFPRMAAAATHGLHGAFGFPIRSGRTILGVMEFFSREVRPPDDDLLMLWAAVGSQIGQFIERKQAEEAVRDSEMRKAAILESALDCVISIDHAGCVTEFNPAAEQTFGYSRAEALGKPLADLVIPPSLRAAQQHGLERYLATGHGPLLNRRIEMRAMRADGTEFPVELAITPVRLEERPGFTGYLRDITARKRAEAERTLLLAREQEARQAAERAAERTQRLQSVTAALATALTSDQVADVIITQGLAALDATRGIVVVLSDDGTVLQTLRRVGYPREVFEAWHQFPAETRAPIADAVREREALVLASREEYLARYPHLAGIQAPGGTGTMVALPLIVGDRAIGGLELALPEGRHVDVEDGTFMHALADLCAQALDRGRLYDAEQRARLEAETATARLQALQSIMDAALAHLALEDLLPQALDRLTAALAVDNAAILLLSEDGENLVLHMARGPEEQVAGQVRVPLGHGIAGHIAATRAPLIVDDLATVEVVNPFLRETIHSVMGVPLVVENRVIGVLHVGTRALRHFTADDMYLLQLAADRIALAIGHAHLYAAERQAHAQAVNAVQERDEFLSVAAHELKTPVTSLCGFAQTLLHVVKGETRIDAPQVRRALQHIDTQSMKLDGLIAQLLDLSRIEAGRLSLDTEVVDLTAVVQGVVAAAQARTSAHTLLVDAPAPIVACLDPVRIEQVLVNLVNNAIKYSPDGGTIDVAVIQHGEVAQVAVRDYGLGIPPEHRAHIFDRFYQAHARSHRSGMGLGLYISRQIVDLHGGSITADFPADGGTRFVVTLPTTEAIGGRR